MSLYIKTVTYIIDAPTIEDAEEVWTDLGPEISEQTDHESGTIFIDRESDLKEA